MLYTTLRSNRFMRYILETSLIKSCIVAFRGNDRYLVTVACVLPET